MTDTELLEKVKKAIGVGGTYHDETLMIYIDEVKEYMLAAGVNKNIVNGRKALGAICRGVLDLWNYGSGNTTLSNYFIQRVIQLSLDQDADCEEVNTNFLLANGDILYTSNEAVFTASEEVETNFLLADETIMHTSDLLIFTTK